MSADVARNACLAAPLACVLVTAWIVRPTATRWAVAGFAGAWVLGALLIAHAVGLPWSYAASPATLLGVPVEALLGWALAWGVLPGLVGGRAWAWGAGFLWLDAVTMPRLAPFVELHETWLVADAALVAAVAVPAVLFSRWTRRGDCLWLRVATQALTAAALGGWVVPTVALHASGASWSDAAQLPAAARAAGVVALSVAVLPGVAATWELGDVGRGTPYPADPPRRLVVTGPYAYVANPMQITVVASYAVLSVLFAAPWLAVAAVVGGAFAATFAEHTERQQMSAAWPEYGPYRRQVRSWVPRYRPYVPGPAVVYVDAACGSCRDLAGTIMSLRPVGLRVVGAPESMRRMTWVGARGETDTGVAAFARCVEHTVLPAAVVGWVVRLPGMRHAVGAAADAAGFAPARSAPAARGALGWRA